MRAFCPQIAFRPCAKLAILTCAVLVSMAPAAALAAQVTPPHVIILLADDLGWGDVGYHGSKIETPNIDKLAKRGTRLNQFYVQPVCSPTRGALMTGRYPMRLGLQCGWKWDECGTCSEPSY